MYVTFMEDITTIPSVAADEAITTNYDNGSEDLIRFRYCSVLAQIEIASCFRNDIEPLFVLFNRLASIPRKPYVLVFAIEWLLTADLDTKSVFRIS